MRVFLFFFLILAISEVRAGESDVSMDKEYAFKATQSGNITEGFNFLQDTLQRPHVDQVWYDFQSDLFHWRGPVTGKEMSMSRKRFMREIWYPYDEGQSKHN
jgi:hypothetical protein